MGFAPGWAAPRDGPQWHQVGRSVSVLYKSVGLCPPRPGSASVQLRVLPTHACVVRATAAAEGSWPLSVSGPLFLGLLCVEGECCLGEISSLPSGWMMDAS